MGCECGSCGPISTTSNSGLASPTLSELDRAMPRIAQMLGVTTDEVKLLDQWGFPTFHNSTSYADHPVKIAGLTDTLPPVQYEALHSKKGAPVSGLILYECRTARHLKYVCYSSKTIEGYRSLHFACKKGELAKIIRNSKKLHKMCNQNVPPVLEDGLLEEIIKNSIYFLLNSKKIEKYGVRIKRGIILDGPPGNGKTMACRYIQKLCTDNDILWGVINASDIDKAFHDNNMDQIFNRFTVTFFDDIDISYLSRKAGNGKMACSILSSMDGMCDAGHTVRVFTTNETIEDLDAAFTRPGRIDRRFIFNKPDKVLRAKLISSWPEEIKDNIDCEYLVDETDDNTFAELEAIRANLVTNYLFGDNTWNLNKALFEFREGMGSFIKTAKRSGFVQPPVTKWKDNGDKRHVPTESPAIAVPRIRN